jgi:hypothetical protein
MLLGRGTSANAQQVMAGGRRSADVYNPPDSHIASSLHTPTFPPTPDDRHSYKHIHDDMGAKASKAVEVEPPKLGKSGKKICCSCPETKKVRCMLTSCARRRNEKGLKGESGVTSVSARVFCVHRYVAWACVCPGGRPSLDGRREGGRGSV